MNDWVQSNLLSVVIIVLKQGWKQQIYHVGSLRAGFLEGHDVDKQVHGLPVGRAENPDAMLVQHIYQGHKPAHCTLGMMRLEQHMSQYRVLAKSKSPAHLLDLTVSRYAQRSVQRSMQHRRVCYALNFLPSCLRQQSMGKITELTRCIWHRKAA